MKQLLFCAFMLVVAIAGKAQTLEKMQWFNEPQNYEIKGKTMTVDVPGHCDYWRISHYGFTVDDAPFYYATYGGEFEAKVKISGDYKVRFDNFSSEASSRSAPFGVA